jgi:hypothetical protein
MEDFMKTPILALIALALSASLVGAAEDGNLTTKAMKDLPGNSGGGAPINPTAKPDSGSLSEKAMQDQPGVNKDTTGKTLDPTAKPNDGSLATKAMKDTPGISK